MNKAWLYAAGVVILAGVAWWLIESDGWRPVAVPNDLGGGRERPSEQIEARIGQGASALDVTVTPQAVLEDSRCPMDAVCIQAGTVRIRATLESGLGTAAGQVFELGQPITTEVEEVELVQVAPEPRAGEEIEASDYRFYFRVSKR